MNTAPLVYRSSHREAPRSVVRCLREIDPTAELVYLRDGRWALGTVRHDADTIQKALRSMTRTFHAVASLTARFPWNRALILDDARDRLDLGLIKIQGFRPITEFRFTGTPDGRIVEAFRQMDWLYRHTSDDAFYRASEAGYDMARTESRESLIDPARARSAWTWAFTKSHTVTRFDDPMRPAAPRAGFSRVTVPSLLS